MSNETATSLLYEKMMKNLEESEKEIESGISDAKTEKESIQKVISAITTMTENRKKIIMFFN